MCVPSGLWVCTIRLAWWVCGVRSNYYFAVCANIWIRIRLGRFYDYFLEILCLHFKFLFKSIIECVWENGAVNWRTKRRCFVSIFFYRRRAKGEENFGQKIFFQQFLKIIFLRFWKSFEKKIFFRQKIFFRSLTEKKINFFVETNFFQKWFKIMKKQFWTALGRTFFFD